MSTFRILNAENLQTLADKVAKVNRKLERNGMDERFSYTVTEVAVESAAAEGVFFTEFDVEFNRPSVDVAGWTFIGSLTHEEGGILFNSVPDADLTGFVRPETTTCDHCKVNRFRKRSFVIRNIESGEIKIVGSTCIEAFFGYEVKGLWLLEQFTADEIAEMNEDRGVSREATSFSVDQVIRLAMVLSDMGRQFVARSAEYGDPTANLVLAVFFPGDKIADIRWSSEMRAQAAQLSEETVAAVIASAESLSDSDYRDNMMVALGSENVSSRALGVLVSLVKVYARNETRKVEAKTNPVAAGFLGQPKDKIADIEATVTAVNWYDNDFGGSDRITFRTADGHVAIWWTASAHGLETGDRVILKATVKAQENFQGQDQTVILRVKTQVMA